VCHTQLLVTHTLYRTKSHSEPNAAAEAAPAASFSPPICGFPGVLGGPNLGLCPKRRPSLRIKGRALS
jgi:hypothetical protein